METTTGAEASEAILQDFCRLITQLSNQKSYASVYNLVTVVAQLRNENAARLAETQQLQAQLETERSEFRTKHEDQTGKHNDSMTDMARTFKIMTEEESAKQKHLERELVATKATYESHQKAANELSEINSRLKQENERLAAQRQSDAANLQTRDTEYKKLEVKYKTLEETSEKQRSQLKSQALTIKQSRSDLRSKDEAHTTLQKELYKVKSDLANFASLTHTLANDDIEADFAKASNLWQECLRVVSDCFEGDISEPVLKDSGKWQRFTDQGQQMLPLPRSNSSAAKQMRTVFALGFLTYNLTTSIFVPSYMPDETAELLYDMVGRNSAKEQFCRGLLLSLADNDSREGQLEKVTYVVKEMTDLVQNLVGDQRSQVFAGQMKNVVQHAATMWQSFEQRKSHIETSTDEGVLTWEWQSLRRQNSSLVLAEETVSGEDFLADGVATIIFPRIFAIGKETATTIFPGVALQKSQILAAKRELLEASNSDTPNGADRARRKAGSSRAPPRNANRNRPFLGSS